MKSPNKTKKGLTMRKLLIFVASLGLMGLGMWLCVENETPWWSVLWLPAAFGFVYAWEEEDK